MGVLEVKKFIVSTALFPNLKKKSVDNKLYFSIFSSNRNLSQCTMAISTKATRISWPVWSKDDLYFVLYNFEPGFSDISDIKLPKKFLFLDSIAKMSPGNGDTFVKAEKQNADATLLPYKLMKISSWIRTVQWFLLPGYKQEYQIYRSIYVHAVIRLYRQINKLSEPTKQKHCKSSALVIRVKVQCDQTSLYGF